MSARAIIDRDDLERVVDLARIGFAHTNEDNEERHPDAVAIANATDAVTRASLRSIAVYFALVALVAVGLALGVIAVAMAAWEGLR